MVVAAFSVSDQIEKIKFFEEIFLLVNISLNVVFRMLFFTLNNADIDFLRRELWWRSYIIKKVFFTTKQVKLRKKKEFATLALDPGDKTFIVHVASFDSFSNN